MWIFISVMCFLGSLACLLGAIVSLFQKQGLHTKYFLISGALFVFFIAAIVAAPASPDVPATANRTNVATTATNQLNTPVKEAPKTVPYTIFEDNKNEKGPTRKVRVMTDATTEAEFRQIVESIRKDSMGFEYVWLYFHDPKPSKYGSTGDFVGAVRFPLTRRGVALSGAKTIDELYLTIGNQSAQTLKSEVAIDVKPYEEAVTKREQSKRVGTISPSLEQFKQAFNASAKQLGLSHQINKINFIDSKQVSFQVEFSDLLFLNGDLNAKDGSLRSAFMAGGTDGTDKTGNNMLLSFVALIAATNPGLSREEGDDILMDLGFVKGNDTLNLKESVIKNGVKYSIQSSKEAGFWFFVEDPNHEY
ncbi:hypothetical protein [Paenibacillus sp. FSL H8-0034]|uniref:hypothetical protein n=1 Tax=Paenibacillus sp. FSL H8-0034 TaxID=2954671 RepID=UPI0030F92141